MQALLRPNVLQFIGGAIAVLMGVFVLKGSTEGPGLVMLGVFTMGNALKSAGDVMEGRKAAAEAKRASQPPAP